MRESAPIEVSSPPPADERAPTSVADLTRQGLDCFKAGDLDEAARYFEAAVEADPERPVCLNNLALALVGLGRLEEASTHLRRSLQLDPSQPESWISLAGLAFRLDRHEEANAASAEAIALDGGNAMAWRIRFLACSRLLDFSGAAEALEAEIRIDGETAELCANLGAVLMHCGQFQRAADQLSRAITLDPSAGPAREAANICAITLLAVSGKIDAACLEDLHRPAPEVETYLRTALLLLDAADEHAARIHLAQAWMAWSPTSLEARHLLDAALSKSVDRQPPQLVAERFDDLADRFDDHLVARLDYAGPKQLREILLSWTSPSKPLDTLDLGCGTGLCGVVLRPHAGRLEGVDLSANMLEKARALGIYDRLEVGDLMDTLGRARASWDLIVAFDTLPYLGNLQDLFAAAADALRPGGLFAFSTEALDGDAYLLRGNGRFAHGGGYIRNAAAQRFEVLVDETALLRREAGHSVLGGYFLLRSTTRSAVS